MTSILIPKLSKGLFFIEIEDYKGPVIVKIYNALSKLIETHHLIYSGLMSWRLGKGVWNVEFSLRNLSSFQFTSFIQ